MHFKVIYEIDGRDAAELLKDDQGAKEMSQMIDISAWMELFLTALNDDFCGRV